MKQIYFKLGLTSTKDKLYKTKLFAFLLVFLLLGCSTKHAKFDINECVNDIEKAKRLPEFSMVKDKDLDSAEICKFFCLFKSAIITNRKMDVAKMIRFPLKTRVNKKRTLIKTEDEFIKNYDSIISPYAKNAVVNQNVLKLWGSWQGAIVGKGEVWINKDRNGKLKVIAILNWPNVCITK